MKFFKTHLFFLVLLIVFAPNSIRAKNFDFSNWDGLLKRYVGSKIIDEIPLNVIDYGKLKSDPVFYQLVSDLKLFIPSQLQTQKEKIAFWINVYNVFAVKMVADNHPLESIKDIGNFFKPVWKYEAGVVGDRNYTLDEIEHKILRKMGEPRIHVAIACASVSCPDLSIDAFSPERLNEQLDAQMRVFLANSKKGMRLDANGKRLHLSKIFEWFREDFDAQGGVLKFIQPYVSPKDRKVLSGLGLRIFFMKYNWRVNDSAL